MTGELSLRGKLVRGRRDNVAWNRSLGATGSLAGNGGYAARRGAWTGAWVV
jgi:hypothetical protein